MKERQRGKERVEGGDGKEVEERERKDREEMMRRQSRRQKREGTEREETGWILIVGEKRNEGDREKSNGKVKGEG